MNQKSDPRPIFFLKSIDLEFIVSLHCLNFCYDFTYPLSKILQTVALDFARAEQEIQNLICLLKQKRENSGAVFNNIWIVVSKIATNFDLQITTPRTTLHQVNRPNYNGNPEEFYRFSIFNPLLDELIMDLCDRFNANTCETLKVSQLLPKNIGNISDQAVKLIYKKYCKLITCESENGFLAEVDLWKNRCQNNKSDDVEDSTKFFFYFSNDEILRNIYPNIYQLLKIYYSIPCSVASGERSFSALRRLKTWLRNSMTEDRLSALGLMHINYNIDINADSIIDRFAMKGHRKIDFLV